MSVLITKFLTRHVITPGNFNKSASFLINGCYRNGCKQKITVSMRTFSASTTGSDDENGTDKSKPQPSVTHSEPGFLEMWNYGVEKFGNRTLKVDVPFSVQIQSLNPQDFPEMDKVFVKLLCDVDASQINTNFPHTLHSLSKLYDLKIDKNNDGVSVHAKFVNIGIEFPILCHIEIPMKYDIDVTNSGKTTLVSNLENKSMKIQTKCNSCTLRNIKSGKIDVHNEGGDILCEKVVQGNLNLRTAGNGKIKTGRLQGLEVNCSTEDGPISSTSIYANKSSFTSKTGNIELSNCHGSSEVKIEKGNLVIDSLDGSMTAQLDCGDVDAYISKAENIELKTREGNVCLKVPETLSSSFELVGNSVSIDPDLSFTAEQEIDCDDQISIQGFINSKEGSVSVSTMKGDVSLEKQDWLNSLKLKLPVLPPNA